jgi:uncharacterized membrane protein YeaQ/YmgE (transglycosylase-associated protein family)
MEQSRWPTPSYLLRLFQTYFVLALVSGGIVMLIALLIADPAAMAGVFAGILIGCVLSFVFSRLKMRWLVEALQSLRRLSDFVRSWHD